MIAEEAAAVAGKVAQTGIDILYKMLCWLLDKDRNSSSLGGNNSANEKKPKVRAGRLSERQYKSLLKNGEKFNILEVPKQKISDLEDVLKKLGVHYHVAEGGKDNSIRLFVPQDYSAQVSAALKYAVEQQLSQNSSSIEVMKGNDLISPEAAQLADDVLSAHDIPRYSFITNEGKVMNCVPKEFSGQYKAAIDTVKTAMKDIESVTIRTFEQTAPLQSTNIRVSEISEKQAEYIAENLKSDKISFLKDNGKIYVQYPLEMRDNINDSLSGFEDVSKRMEMYKIAVLAEGERNLPTRNTTQKLDYNAFYDAPKIEIFDKAHDKLISIGFNEIERLDSILMDNGMSKKDTDIIVNEVKKQLPPGEQERIGYTPIKAEYISDETVPNIIKTAEIAAAVEHMENVGDSERGERAKGSMCVIYDEDRKKYVIADPNLDDKKTIKHNIEQLGYDTVQTAAIMSKLYGLCREENITLREEKTESKHFDSMNAELLHCSYISNENGIAIVKEDTNKDGIPEYRYITAEQGASRPEIEKAIREGLDIKDAKTVVECLKCLENDKLIPVPEQIDVEGCKVSLVSTQTYEISKEGITITSQKGKANIKATAEELGISEKQAARMIARIEKSMDRKPSTLDKIKATAKEKYAEIQHAKDKNKERSEPAKEESR